MKTVANHAACGLQQIIAAESAQREFAPELVRRYFTEHIRYEIGPRQQKGLKLFLKMARPLDTPGNFVVAYFRRRG